MIFIPACAQPPRYSQKLSDDMSCLFTFYVFLQESVIFALPLEKPANNTLNNRLLTDT